MEKRLQRYKAIDFFCGGGGMTCGLRQAGINVIAGVDIDKEAKETYEFNNKGTVFINKDIRRVHSDYFERNFNLSRNNEYSTTFLSLVVAISKVVAFLIST